MARHTAIVMAEPVDGQTEAETGKLAAKIQAIVNGQTIITMAACKFGQKMAVAIVYDTA
jgi:ABC-type uncharacterized transport system ATPase subunit